MAKSDFQGLIQHVDDDCYSAGPPRSWPAGFPGRYPLSLLGLSTWADFCTSMTALNSCFKPIPGLGGGIEKSSGVTGGEELCSSTPG